MGVLYKARHLELDIIRALKVIVPEHTADSEFRARFKREWRLAARIEHPNVIPVHEVGEEDGLLYISMRFIEGQDLGRLISNEGPLEPNRVANIIDQIAYALDAAHEAGLVHRDVKPANILIESDSRGEKAYLTDFGLTKAAASQTAMTASGMFVGTIDYMSPEQFEGDTLDARADVYALGCVLYEALTGRVPFARDGYQARIFAHMSSDPPMPSDAVPGLPDEFDEVVARSMAKNPDERFLSAGDLGRAALAAAQGQRVSRAQRNVARGDAAPKSAAPVGPLSESDDAQEEPAEDSPLPRLRPSVRPRSGLAPRPVGRRARPRRRPASRPPTRPRSPEPTRPRSPPPPTRPRSARRLRPSRHRARPAPAPAPRRRRAARPRRAARAPRPRAGTARVCSRASVRQLWPWSSSWCSSRAESSGAVAATAARSTVSSRHLQPRSTTRFRAPPRSSSTARRRAPDSPARTP